MGGLIKWVGLEIWKKVYGVSNNMRAVVGCGTGKNKKLHKHDFFVYLKVCLCTCCIMLCPLLYCMCQINKQAYEYVIVCSVYECS